MANDYRGYLYSIAQDVPGTLGAQEANALLQVVGNDGGINQNFLADPYKYTGNPLGHVVSNNVGYGPQGIQDLNSKYFTNYTQNTPTTPQFLGASTGGTTGSTVDNTPYINLINSAIGRLPGELQTAQNNVQTAYNTNLNELNSGKQATDQQYGQSTAQNGQQFVTNKNQINDQASQGLRSLLADLGQHGAGGSSAAMYAVPNAVGQVASQQRAGAGQTFGQNQQALDTNYNTYLRGFENSKKQLADWLIQQRQAAQSQSEQTRQSLLQELAGLQPSVAAAQPYIDQINASANQVDQLAKFNPSYTGKTPVYNAPSVASYTVQAPGAPVLGQPGNNTGAGTPILNFLLGQQKDKHQNQLAF